MKQGIALEQLSEELSRIHTTMEDYVVDTRKMSFNTHTEESPEEGRKPQPVSVLSVDDAGDDGGLRTFRVNDYCHGQIAERVGIPKRYYDRMRADAPPLLDRNVFHWFTTEPHARMVRTVDGTARAFLSDRYHRIDNYDIFRVVYPIVKQTGADIVSCALTDKKMYLKFTWPHITAPIDTPRKVGDVITAGMIAENSEVGAGAFLLAPYTVVLSCTNGMTLTKWGQRKIHVGSRIEEGSNLVFASDTIKAQDEAFALTVRDVVRQVATQEAFDALVQDLRHLPQFKMEGHPPAVVEKLSQKHNLTQEEASSVLRHLIEGADLSAWGYVSAVTRAAEDVDSYDRASELEALGGALAVQPEKEWAALATA